MVARSGEPESGELQRRDSNNFVYIPPDNNFLGEVHFDYIVTDGTETDRATVTIMVDLSPPEQSWLLPTDNVYYIQDDAETVTFEVEASDNAGVQRVVLKDYDPIRRTWVVIAGTTTPPYRFNVKAIKMFRHWNQIRAWVYDENGNLTITDVIFVWQQGRTALPVINR